MTDDRSTNFVRSVERLRDAAINAEHATAHDAFSVCIHRGTQQIGGTCIELSCQGKRMLLDLGLPLDSGETDPVTLLPPIPGLHTPDPGLLGLVLSHGHADHWGLVPYIEAALPIVTGAATRRILRAAAAFVPRAVPLGTESDGGRPDLEDRKTIQLGPFAITPFLVDHSAFDAYALLIEANGRRLFYSGDIRAHGRKAALFERLVSNPPRPIHAMLMEGSSLGRLNPDQLFPTEREIEERLVVRLRAPGFVSVCASAQNIDRVVSLYRACKRTGRTLVLDLYALEVLAATGNSNIPGRAGRISRSTSRNTSGGTSSAQSGSISSIATSRIASIASTLPTLPRAPSCCSGLRCCRTSTWCRGPGPARG